jgi:hypothetical protein
MLRKKGKVSNEHDRISSPKSTGQSSSKENDRILNDFSTDLSNCHSSKEIPSRWTSQMLPRISLRQQILQGSKRRGPKKNTSQTLTKMGIKSSKMPEESAFCLPTKLEKPFRKPKNGQKVCLVKSKEKIWNECNFINFVMRLVSQCFLYIFACSPILLNRPGKKKPGKML